MTSIFIPRIDFAITKMEVKDYFEGVLGPVSRVDFVSFNSERGVGRRAFVHFSAVHHSEWKDELIAVGYVDAVLKNTNIRCLANNNPVPVTTLNFDQVASNTEFIGEELKVHAVRIETLEKQLAEKNVELEAMKDAMYRMDQTLYYLMNRC